MIFKIMKIITELKNGLNNEAINQIDEFCRKNEGKEIVLEMKVPRNTRTLLQNSALHKWFTMIAEKLIEDGQTFNIKLGTAQSMWSRNTVKENLFRPIMKAITKKESTTELTTKEVGELEESMHDVTSRNFHFTIPFPSKERLLK